MAKTRLSRCIQLMGATGLSCSTVRCVRRVTMRSRCLKFGAPKVGALGKHPVEAGEVQSWAWDQCGQAGNKIQRFQHDMGRSIPEGMFVAVNDPAPVRVPEDRVKPD